jgi:cytochrome c2
MCAVAIALSAMADVAAAADKKVWRLGRVYYRMVCTECHVSQADKKIGPNSRTIAEWKAYLDADAHDATGKSEAKLSHYTSTGYRESVKDTNKAAKKFLKMSDADLHAAVSAWVVYGAKDSDNPASCQ